jgi:hypothetical protein
MKKRRTKEKGRVGQGEVTNQSRISQRIASVGRQKPKGSLRAKKGLQQKNRAVLDLFRDGRLFC